jgi:hypothetical protein
VAIHDLSFWSATLPLLDGFTRVAHEYSHTFAPTLPMTLDSKTGSILHAKVLSEVKERWYGPQPDRSDSDMAVSMAGSLIIHLKGLGAEGDPQIEGRVVGCGVVVGGSFDLVVGSFLTELKLTAKRPNIRDMRQALVYAALMHLSGRPPMRSIVVANPRLGESFVIEIEDLLMMTGGLRISEFGDRLADFLTAPPIV